nr:hypothetical protein CFP56_61087 [Quercus suber]
MVDFTFDIEIHVGGCFVEEPTIKNVGGYVRLLTEIDPDKLSFFEIQDLCHLVGSPKEHSIYKYLLPEVEYPDEGGVADGGVGGDGLGGVADGVGGDAGGDVGGDVSGLGGDAARGGESAPRSAPEPTQRPPSQQPTQTYNMMSTTQPSSSSQQGNQPRPSHRRAGWFSSS